jgi:hypothetical protein
VEAVGACQQPGVSIAAIALDRVSNNPKLWAMALVGVGLGITIALSRRLLPSEKYGCWDIFRANINPFPIGLIVGIPLLQLAAVRGKFKGVVSCL